eukprot:TRINITY_DN11854_c0_g1_i1.p1 TRINITY_DN11854_c0_g1~~TRINITY_DN11854_c0_g1_i1.p1  ORF type:complete len:148 (-),score=28.73 TRINITY_DN11854_c0_g1_i1:2-445(-)
MIGSNTAGSNVWILTANNTQHSVTTTSSNWTSIPGLHINFPLTTRRYVRVDAHCHGNAGAEERRLDFCVFVDGRKCGIGGYECGYNGDPENGVNGMGLSHLGQWVPVMAVAMVTLDPGAHNVEVRIRNGANNGAVYANGAAAIVTIY